MTAYRFNSETEPSEEQLHTIMREAAEDARSTNEKATTLFFQQLLERILALK